MKNLIEIIYDIEVYNGKVCISFIRNNKFYTLDRPNDFKKLPLDNDKYLWIGFNNRKYDHPILEMLKKGITFTEAYQMSQNMIVRQQNHISWATNIVDLYEICPTISRCSLKEFGHRLKYPILQNLPYPFDKKLNDEEWEHVKKYNVHDVNITKMLWDKLKPEYEARQSLKSFFDIKTEYGGAPRLAEKAILSKLDGSSVTNTKELYKMNNLILSPKSKELYDMGFNITPDTAGDFKKIKHKVKGCKLTIGVGGIHGIQQPGIYENVYDYDVTSYYPSIILNCKLGSAKFRDIYRKVYNLRLKLKERKDPKANSLKLVLNSLYGKLSDTYASKQIYAPNIGISICLLGQFYLIDLIEKLPENECLMVNTDGIITKTPINENILEEWEKRTGFKMTLTKYTKLVLKDVNSYYAINDDGYEKRKKEFNGAQWTHNFKAQIIQKAVLNNILHNIPISDTINSADDIYDFCFFSKANQKDNKFLLLDDVKLSDPKIRYYVATKGHILERVSEKSRAKICKDSPIQLEMNLYEKNSYDNINRQWYIDRAKELVDKISA